MWWRQHLTGATKSVVPLPTKTPHCNTDYGRSIKERRDDIEASRDDGSLQKQRPLWTGSSYLSNDMNNLVANSTPQTSSRNEKRSSSEQRVSFEDGIEINFVENLSQNHKDDLWFTEVELRTFKRQAGPRLRRASNANNINTVHQRREIRRVVLSEQHRQRHAGIVKPERIANISEAASVLSRKQARIMALEHSAVLNLAKARGEENSRELRDSTLTGKIPRELLL